MPSLKLGNACNTARKYEARNEEGKFGVAHRILKLLSNERHL